MRSVVVRSKILKNLRERITESNSDTINTLSQLDHERLKCLIDLIFEKAGVNYYVFVSDYCKFW